MSRVCSINGNKGVMSGNNVSHSNRKTRRRFLPNIKEVSFWSEIMNSSIKITATTHGIRTVEHNDGIDNYALSTPNRKLTKELQVIKKRLLKTLNKKKAAVTA
jgi:large subunit ribosomal protein L28